MLQVGIIGLPNVGKSTLFNALLKKQSSFAQASAGQASSGLAKVANYPFTTIEPNIGVVPVPDERLEKIRKIVEETEAVKSLPIVPATVKFVDIAGLVKGAAQGEGLGNQFLAHIREVDLICHVVRNFEDPNVAREGDGNPKSDIEIVNTELILADLQTLQKAESEKREADSAIKKLKEGLNAGKMASEVLLTNEEREAVQELQLLTSKKVLYVVNTSYGPPEQADLGITGAGTLAIDAKTEAELAAFTAEEQKEYLDSLGISEPGLDRLIKKAYHLLGLISFFTITGLIEVRAWTLEAGSSALSASAKIHTDFYKQFIRAEVIDYSDFLSYNGRKGAQEKGAVHLEGKDYIVKDGDIIEFRVAISQ